MLVSISMVSFRDGSVFAIFWLGGGGNLLSNADRFDPAAPDWVKDLSLPSVGHDGVLVESFVGLVKLVGVALRCFPLDGCCSLADIASSEWGGC